MTEPLLRVQDLSVSYGRVHAVRILGLGERRGPATEAQALYSDVDALQQARPLEPGPEPDT